MPPRITQHAPPFLVGLLLLFAIGLSTMGKGAGFIVMLAGTPLLLWFFKITLPEPGTCPTCGRSADGEAHSEAKD